MENNKVKSVITIEKPYTISNNVILKNKFAILCLAIGFVVNAFYMYFESDGAIQRVLNEYSSSQQEILLVTIYFTISFVFSAVTSCILGAITDVFHNPRKFFISLLTVFGALLILIFGALKGILKFTFQLVRILMNFIIFLLTKVSKRAYQHFTTYETFYT